MNRRYRFRGFNAEHTPVTEQQFMGHDNNKKSTRKATRKGGFSVYGHAFRLMSL